MVKNATEENKAEKRKDKEGRLHCKSDICAKT